jgi:excisionase family DNA binding protein
MHHAAVRPQLLTVAEAASLLKVSEKTVRRWVAGGKCPYVKLSSGEVRMPRGALLASLEGTHDLAAEIAALDARFADVSEDDVRAVTE